MYAITKISRQWQNLYTKSPRAGSTPSASNSNAGPEMGAGSSIPFVQHFPKLYNGEILLEWASATNVPGLNIISRLCSLFQIFRPMISWNWSALFNPTHINFCLKYRSKTCVACFLTPPCSTTPASQTPGNFNHNIGMFSVTGIFLFLSIMTTMNSIVRVSRSSWFILPLQTHNYLWLYNEGDGHNFHTNWRGDHHFVSSTLPDNSPEKIDPEGREMFRLHLQQVCMLYE